MAGFKWHNHVWKNGPEYVTDRAVMLVLVDLMDDQGRVKRAVATIADRAGITERCARNRLRVMESQGWIDTDLGGGRHHVNTYWPNLTRLSTTANPEQTRNEIPGINPERSVVNPERSVVNPERRSAHSLNTLSTRSSHALAPTVADVVPGILVAIPDDDDASEKELIRVALHGIVGTTTLARSRSWHRDVLAALARGWTAAALNAHVHARMAATNGGRIDVGLARRIIQEDDPPTAGQQRPEMPPWCGECDESSRMLDWDGDHPHRCPTCNPRALSA